MKTSFRALALIWALSFSAIIPSASADTLDRINQCEESGQRSCIFDVLRELAARSGGSGELRMFSIYNSGMVDADCSDRYKVASFPLSDTTEKAISNCLATLSGFIDRGKIHVESIKTSSGSCKRLGMIYYQLRNVEEVRELCDKLSPYFFQ